ncbi:arsenic resistance N-acetyltransferase ArsN2 [Burkholderia cepacia]|uniref:Amino-acid acetyltransferase n=1 Tax=Burkholderia cepacia TaxID=292 RepID=A0A8I1AWT7_BURCE|nr:arsenic resistance N-acetyltransferase ArsN2 [Burkholderia cepacia]MBA9902019.1 GNAT family N-acetyltransferase [Burkholderia cepacia]MBA9948973.1 GNAT family N-acetyltransferase [Burkholderia cepacia]MBA9979234.1 GNAT family N-acetyltransferase [Burkholderia cepacia]MBA9998023.1 GNAT family N-acetyltransferase [Burkholderia cepacia]MBB0006109.1 GNAT family N-acetyltransferase [Burkholderia cepacia]
MNIREARPDDLDSIRKLLDLNQLPTADVTEALLSDFLVVGDPRLVAVAGLERFDDIGLLRSLAVSGRERSQGIGKRLVEAVEEKAKATGISSLWLLTTTATNFFVAVGYSVVTRDDAPAGLRNSSEFRDLCPASATCMRKLL